MLQKRLYTTSMSYFYHVKKWHPSGITVDKKLILLDMDNFKKHICNASKNVPLMSLRKPCVSSWVRVIKTIPLSCPFFFCSVCVFFVLWISWGEILFSVSGSVFGWPGQWRLSWVKLYFIKKKRGVSFSFSEKESWTGTILCAIRTILNRNLDCNLFRLREAA